MKTTEPGSAPSWRAHDLAACALGPELELIGRRGAERVGRGEHDALAVGDLLRRELADRRRLPDTVDTDEHPDVDLARNGVERPVRSLLQDRRHLVAQQAEERVRIGDVLDLGPVAHRAEQPLRGRHADIGEQQRFFELVPRVVVDLVAAHRAQVARQRGAGPTEPVAQAGLDDRFGFDDDVELVDAAGIDDDLVDDELVDRARRLVDGEVRRRDIDVDRRRFEHRRRRARCGGLARDVPVLELRVAPRHPEADDGAGDDQDRDEDDDDGDDHRITLPTRLGFSLALRRWPPGWTRCPRHRGRA